MSHQVHEIIESLLDSNWTETPIAYENVPFNPVRGEPFIVPRFTGSESSIINARSQKVYHRSPGIFTIECYESITLGSRGVQTMAGKLAKIFRGYDDGSLRFFGPHLVRRGQQEEWFRGDLLIQYNEDECLGIGAVLQAHLSDQVEISDQVQEYYADYLVELEDQIAISGDIDLNAAGGYGAGGYGTGPYGE